MPHNISDIVHDIRSALSSIRLNSEMLLLNPEVDEKIRRVLVSNIKEVDRISAIAGKLLQ